jgi:hypothetical protein
MPVMGSTRDCGKNHVVKAARAIGLWCLSHLHYQVCGFMGSTIIAPLLYKTERGIYVCEQFHEVDARAHIVSVVNSCLGIAAPSL